MRSLAASLGDHSMAMLRGIAQLRGVVLAGNAREEAAAQLAAVLAEPDSLATALAACSPAARSAWQDLAAAGGQLKMPAFTRRYGEIRPMGPGKLERETPWQQPANAAEELWYLGIAFRGFADLGEGPNEYLYVPDELRHPAGGAQPPRPPGFPDPLPATLQPRAGRASRFVAAADLCALLAAARDAPVRLEGGRLPAGSLAWRGVDEARMREGLLLADPVRLRLLACLGEEMGCLAEDRQRLVMRTDTTAAWMRSRPWQQETALYRAWAGSTRWNDLRSLPSLRAEGSWRNDPLAARRAVLAAVGRARSGEWYDAAELASWMKRLEPDFQRPDGDYAAWYLRDEATERYLSGYDSWDDVEGRLIHWLVTGPLFWLGAVELGTTPREHARAFRLTPAGAAWLSGAAAPPPARPARLEVGGDFVIRAPLALPLLDRFRLLRFTDPAGEPGGAASSPGAVDAAGEPAAGGAPPPAAEGDGGVETRRRITRRSLARARTAGLDGERLLHYLRRTSGGRVPGRVAAALERWQQHGGSVRVHQGAVLRVEDAGTLAALRAEPAVAPLLGELLSAQAAMVSSAALPRLLALLEELGYSVRTD